MSLLLLFNGLVTAHGSGAISTMASISADAAAVGRTSASAIVLSGSSASGSPVARGSSSSTTYISLAGNASAVSSAIASAQSRLALSASGYQVAVSSGYLQTLLSSSALGGIVQGVSASAIISISIQASGYIDAPVYAQVTLIAKTRHTLFSGYVRGSEIETFRRDLMRIGYDRKTVVETVN